jgi:hypothetical protein
LTKSAEAGSGGCEAKAEGWFSDKRAQSLRGKAALRMKHKAFNLAYYIIGVNPRIKRRKWCAAFTRGVFEAVAVS